MSDVAHRQRIDFNRASSTHHSEGRLLEASRAFDEVLFKAGLGARLTICGVSIEIGHRPTIESESLPEFVFVSVGVFNRLMSTLNLRVFAHAFFLEQIDILGSLSRAVDVLYAINVANDTPQTFFERFRTKVFHSAKALIPAIANRFESDAHYSMSDEAYELFLDPYMQYTCGKFLHRDDTLADSQVRKFELIREWASEHIGPLKGKNHLDIGCGWGGLVAYFSAKVGARSVGNTNNERQRKYARERFGADVIFGDFSALSKTKNSYDIVTIVGMIEHLTPHRRDDLFEVVSEKLSPNGLIYLQCIARPSVWIGGDAYRVAYEDVFPGHYLESRSELETRFEKMGFDILHVADDAADYAKTTLLWAENIQKNRRLVSELVGEKNYRIFVGYLMYASKLFGAGRGSLLRYMLAPRGNRA